MILLFSIMFQAAGKVATGGDILHRTCRGGYMGIVWAQAVSDMITALVALILLFRLVLYNDIRMC